MTQLAITVFGHDRPGIIAQTTAALAELGLNLEDSTMTLLRGHFAMMLVTSGGSATAVERSLADLTSDGSLSVSVRDVPEETPVSGGTSYLLHVHGADRPGIVSSVVAQIAEVGGNITDLSTRLAGGLYVLTAECDLPSSADADAVEGAIKAVGISLGVDASLRLLDSDDL